MRLQHARNKMIYRARKLLPRVSSFVSPAQQLSRYKLMQGMDW